MAHGRRRWKSGGGTSLLSIGYGWVEVVSKVNAWIFLPALLQAHQPSCRGGLYRPSIAASRVFHTMS